MGSNQLFFVVADGGSGASFVISVVGAAGRFKYSKPQAEIAGAVFLETSVRAILRGL